MTADEIELSDTWIRREGVVIAVLGTVAFVAYPVYYVEFVFDPLSTPMADAGKLLVVVGACVIVWGLIRSCVILFHHGVTYNPVRDATAPGTRDVPKIVTHDRMNIARTGRFRPLTPERALLIPALVLSMGVLIDQFTTGRVIEILLRDHSPAHTLGMLFARLPRVIVGGSTFPLVGVALRQRNHTWVAVGVGLVLAAFWLASGPHTQGMPILITVVGIPFAVFGFAGSCRS